MSSSVLIKRREAQFEALMLAAEKRICAQGVHGLKARDLATDIGVALGGLYNIVEDMDTLMLKIASRTMQRLDQTLSEAALMIGGEGPEAAILRLETIGHAYYNFARENPKLWRALFEMRLMRKDLPEWNISEQLGLMGHILAPLKVLMPAADETHQAITCRTLFSAVHGIVIIGLEARLIAVPPEALTQQISWLVHAACHNLRGTTKLEV
jgi:AcrR family transcriptional regulator